MNQKHTVIVPEYGIAFSTGSIGRLANGAVNVTVGETNVFVAATVAATTKPGQDWFPLTVDYREKYHAAGRFPGGYFKREGRPTEKEILTSRLCDRPCRPLFPEGFLNEVQVIGILLSADQKNESDIAMVNGASAALAISDIPWNGPIAASRIGLIDGQFVANPTIEQMFSSSLDLIYVGNEKDMLMIEGSDGGGLAVDPALAHHEDAQRRVRQLAADIHVELAPTELVQIVRIALPVPRQPLGEHREGDVLDPFHQLDQPLVVCGPAGREADAAVAHHHRRDAVPRRGLHAALPGGLAVVVGVDVDEAGGNDAVPGVDLFRTAPATLPTAAMHPSLTATSPSNPSPPVPS